MQVSVDEEHKKLFSNEKATRDQKLNYFKAHFEWRLCVTKLVDDERKSFICMITCM